MSDPTPVEVEVTASTIDVEYAGQTYTFPASLDKASGDVVDAVDDEKISHALRGLMSEKDWQRFKATKPLVEDYGGLFNAFAQRIGLGSTGG